jgi:crotonobetaine/carnitine-CoA ligase
MSEQLAPEDYETLYDTLPTFLSERAAEYGDNTWIVHGDTGEELTYRETNERANAMGNSFHEMGLEVGDKVSILCSQPPRVFESIFGITKAGGVASPINYEYFGRELSYQINDTNPEYLVVDDRYAERLNDIAADIRDPPKLIRLRTDDESVPFSDDFGVTAYEDLRTGDRTRPPDVDLSWNDDGIILYTSGTTGDPKGAVISHRMMLANQTYPTAAMMNEEDVYSNPLPTYHMGGFVPVVACLHGGGKCVLWNDFSPNEFWERVQTYEVTFTLILSVMLDWLWDQPEQPDDHKNPLKFASLQPIPDFYQGFAERFSIDILYAGFGQTESGSTLWGLLHAADGDKGTPDSHLRGVPPEEMIETARRWGVEVKSELPGDMWLGQPEAAYEATILDENDEELPPNETGELAIRSKLPSMMFDRYFRKPQKTAEAFDNFWFHTGDLARRDEEGNLFFVDRKSNIMRRRGENISPAQLEEPLQEFEAVDQVAVFPVPAEEGGEDEVTVVVQPYEGGSISESEIEDHLSENLPDYMQPKYIEVWEQIPLTPTNKVQIGETKDQFMGSHPDFA